MAEHSTLKRQHSDSIRYFNPSWEETYFFTEYEGHAKCLVCFKILNQFKKFNIQRHYNGYHANEYAHFSRDERLLEIQRLKAKLIEAEDLIDKNWNYALHESHIQASYLVALEIAKSQCPFIDSELVKRCLIIAAEQMCPEEVKNFKYISMSRKMLTQCIDEMALDVRQQLSNIARTLTSFSLALDKSIDISGIHQLAIFIRGVNTNVEITEELLDICYLKENTSGVDIFACVEKSIEYNNLQWKNLVSVATDGTPAMTDANTGFVGCLGAKLESLGITRKVTAIHCIIHQQNLCSKSVRMDNVMSVVVRTINYVHRHGAKQRHFRKFLEEIEAEYGELPYHIEICWLSRGKVLERFFKLREEIAVFMDTAGHPVPELGVKGWIMDLGFLSDIFDHLNELNVNFQDKQSTIIDLYNAVRAFKMKLQLWMRKLLAGDASHFPNLETVATHNDFETYSDILKILLEEFESRFQDVVRLEKDLKIIDSPFTADVDTVPSHLQLELIDLICDSRLERKFQKQCLLQFYNNFDQSKFPHLHTLATNVLSMFGSTYVCEQLFSILKRTKSAERNRISDDSLKSTLILSTSQTIAPNVTELVQQKRFQDTND